MKVKNLLLFTIMFLFAAGAAAFAQTLDELLAEGDNYTEQFNDQKAFETYQKADTLFPNNWKVYWRLSRATVDIAEHMPTSTDEQEDAQEAKFHKALKYAEKSVELDSTKSVTYLRVAIANGKIALFKGVFSVGGIVNSGRDACEKAIALNNGGNYIQAIAHYVLARTHAKVSTKWAPARSILGLGWADLDSALVHYKIAEKLKPNFVMIELDYARALMRDDKYKLAKEKLEKAIAAPIQDEDDEAKKAEAKKLLVEVNEELE